MRHRLIVVRHAKSDYPAGVPDHDRPLRDRGRRDAREIGRWLAAHVTWTVGSAPLVLVSSATRAQETWSIASEQLPEPGSGLVQRTEPRIYDASVPVLLGVIDEIPEAVEAATIVGHNPGLLSLVNRLGIEDDIRLAATEKFPTSAIAVLETDDDWVVATARPESWAVTAFAAPRGGEPG